MSDEVGLWIVVALMAIGGGIGFLGRLGMWLVFRLGASGKLKVRIVDADSKGEGSE